MLQGANEYVITYEFIKYVRADSAWPDYYPVTILNLIGSLGLYGIDGSTSRNVF
jgi:hypothetical protein